MSFFDRFEIRSIVSQRCLRARDKVTGLNVLVHAVSPDRELVPLLRRRARLVCEGSHEGVEYAATPDREELLDLAAWKSLQRIPADLVVDTKTTAGEEKPSQSGDFTVMFRVPNAAQHQTLSAEQEPAAVEPVPPAPAPPEPAKVGEFTAMFQVPSRPAPVAPDPTPDPPRPATDVGEFTAMFRSASPVEPERPQPKATPQEPPAKRTEDEETRLFAAREIPSAPPVSTGAPAPAPAPTGEFTRLFRPAQTPPQPPPPVVRTQPAPAAAASDFDRFFNSSYSSDPEAERRLRSGAPVLPEAPSTRDPGEFTRVFGTKDVQPVADAGPSGATGAFAIPGGLAGTPVDESTAAGPSEYTRLFQTPQTATESTPAASPALPAPAEVSTPSKFPSILLYVLLGVLACAAIGAVLYFALRH